MIKVLVSGASGRMGTAAVAAISADSELELVGQVSRPKSLQAAIAECRPEVVVDLTVAEVGVEHARVILNAGASPVIGTSGFTETQVAELQALSRKKNIGGVIAPNFAIGAVLMMQLSAQVARYFDRVEIIESHHDKKLDSPSGTAVKTAEMIAEARRSVIPALPDTAILPGARGAEFAGIHLHSLRIPGVVAEQQVVFGALGQTLTIQHRSIDRQSFMPGVLLACKRVGSLNELVYGLEHLL